MRHLICFGDSITAGWDGSSETPALTERLKAGLDGWKVRNAGVPGDNTDGAVARLETDVLNHPYDKVTVLFGANDSSFHKGIPIQKFSENLMKIIDAVSAEKCVLMTPLPVIERKQQGKRTNERIIRYASIVAAVAEETGSMLIDLHRLALKESGFKGFLRKDGLHFTGKGYDFIAKQIIREIRQSGQ